MTRAEAANDAEPASQVAPLTPAGEPASEALVRDELSRRLCALITEGEYKPGHRMTERELCERLNASRPSIRETLRQLEAEGLIDIVPNKGAVVRPLNVHTLLQLWEVRLALETLAVERFARHGKAAHLAQLVDAVDAMEAALSGEKPTLIKAAKHGLYDAFCAGSQNDALTRYIEKLNVRLGFLWSTSLAIPGRPAESIGELRVLIEAIRSRNPERARSAITLHSEHAKAIAMYALSAFEHQQALVETKPAERKGAQKA